LTLAEEQKRTRTTTQVGFFHNGGTGGDRGAQDRASRGVGRLERKASMDMLTLFAEQQSKTKIDANSLSHSHDSADGENDDNDNNDNKGIHVLYLRACHRLEKVHDDATIQEVLNLLNLDENGGVGSLIEHVLGLTLQSSMVTTMKVDGDSEDENGEEYAYKHPTI